MNLPNKLTVARLVLIPLLVLCMSFSGSAWAWGAFIIFVLASLTDFFDGRIARSRGLVTDLGKFLDPLADKALISAILICHTAVGFAAPAAVIIIMIREFMVSGIRMIAVQKGRVVAANIFGKAKTMFQMVSLSAILFFTALTPDFAPLGKIAVICSWINAVITALSGIVYLVDNKDVFSDSAEVKW